MTLPERLLWNALRKGRSGFRVRRQHPVGPYVLDFFLPEALLCVEVDGQGHEVRVAQDIERDKVLESLGVRTIRISASDVLKNLGEVAYAIHVIACERVGRKPEVR